MNYPKKKQVIMQQQQGGEEVVKRLTHYRSDHKILLVGEGDFSFSLCLARSFASASNIVASSLDSYDEVTKKYKRAKSNLDELQNLGACLLHGVDATKMKLQLYLGECLLHEVLKFDRIIFNFPHAGFHRKEDHPKMIKMHKNLVLGFFDNARCLLQADGEIHVNHKTSAPFCDWNLEELGRQNFLTLNECVNFNKEDYPGYNNKRGAYKKYNNKRGYSNRCDAPFPLGECSTFKFIHNPRALGKRKWINHMTFRQQRHPPFQATPTSASYSAHAMSLGSQRSMLSQPRTKSTNVTSFQSDHVRREDPVLSSVGARNKGYQINGHHSNYLQEASGPTAETSGYNFNSVKMFDFEKSDTEARRKTLIGAVNERNHHVFGVSSNSLQGTLCRAPENACSFDRMRSGFQRRKDGENPTSLSDAGCFQFVLAIISWFFR